MHSWIDETSLIPNRETRAKFRLKIFDAFEHKCAYCHRPAQSLDHVVPRHRGGQTIVENLVPACLRCNGSKGATEWTLWYREQDFYCKDKEIAVWNWIYQLRSLPLNLIPSHHCCSDL